MGLFKAKPANRPVDDANAAAEALLLDEQYREELRQIGRDHFKTLIDNNAELLRQEIDNTLQQTTLDLKEYLAKQLDTMVATVNNQITDQLNDRIRQYNDLAAEAQDLAAQSLTRHSQAVYEKYQQFSATLQQTIAGQEVQMVTVFQDNKARIVAAQAEQDRALQELSQLTEKASQQSAQLEQAMQKAITDQVNQLAEASRENDAQIASARQLQAEATQKLQLSAQSLEQQYQQLSDFLDKSIVDQKAMLISSINDNMARIIEHYLIGALGEQSDLRSQLPSILEQLEQTKQAMVDDMQL